MHAFVNHSFMPIVILLGFEFVPHTLALQCPAVFLPIPTLNECLATSLAKGDVGFAAVVIQGVGIHRHKFGKTEIGRVHHGFDHRLKLDVSGGNIIFQSHIQLRYFLDKSLQHQGTVVAVRPIPLCHPGPAKWGGCKNGVRDAGPLLGRIHPGHLRPHYQRCPETGGADDGKRAGGDDSDLTTPISRMG